MFSHTPQFIPQKMLVVGCGGTGSRLIPLIAQFVKTCAWVLDPEMIIVDNDEVEEKNLKRQNFVKQDIDKKKANVLAQRYSKAYDITIIPFLDRVGNTELGTFNRESDFAKKIGEWNRSQAPILLVMCVDSAEARRDILQSMITLLSQCNVLVMDTGNENDFGQVKVGTFRGLITYKAYLKELQELPNTIPVTAKLPVLPLDLGYYATMESSAAPSCADLDQTMAINSMVANVAFGFIQNWYYGKPVMTHKINISLTHGCIPEYLTAKYVSDVAAQFTKYRKEHIKKDHPTFNNVQTVDASDVIEKALVECKSYLLEVKRIQDEEAARALEKAAAEVSAPEVEFVAVAEEKPIKRKKAAKSVIDEAKELDPLREEAFSVAA